ncbi:MAG: hypothetical protein JXR25_17385 [Pontiellaceae bacterium]|nr:hypothetical protein [Pontiellaceae bacterium]MBN2786594.1 hypothetical protein [Pontiellaceae bacterium]
MKLNTDKMQRFDMENMAGFGPAAWNRGEMSIKVSARPGLKGRRIVYVDHEQRQREVARNPERNRIPKAEMFEERGEPWGRMLLQSSIGAVLLGLLYFGTS